VTIKAGQSVTFAGAFDSHPLNPDCGSSNPIQGTTTGTSASFTFPAAGTYGFNCNIHGAPNGSGMSGVIEVVP
jgi:plastocyanin